MTDDPPATSPDGLLGSVSVSISIEIPVQTPNCILPFLWTKEFGFIAKN
jgi:hypothetical protein